MSDLPISKQTDFRDLAAEAAEQDKPATQPPAGGDRDWPDAIVIERKPQDDPIRPLHYYVLDGTQSTDFSDARRYTLSGAGGDLAERLRGRKDTLDAIRALTPHELRCDCPAGGGDPDLGNHADECPRGVVHAILAAVEKQPPANPQPVVDPQVEKPRWAVGDRLQHPVGSVWELVEHVGGSEDDWRGRCIEAHITPGYERYGTPVGKEIVFHREYMDRTFTKLAPDPPAEECGRCLGTRGIWSKQSPDQLYERLPCPDCQPVSAGGEDYTDAEKITELQRVLQQLVDRVKGACLWGIGPFTDAQKADHARVGNALKAAEIALDELPCEMPGGEDERFEEAAATLWRRLPADAGLTLDDAEYALRAALPHLQAVPTGEAER